MSGIGGWLKSNILIVIFAVLIIALPIAGYFGSSMWNEKIRTQAEEKLSTKKRQVDGVARVTYTLPAIREGESPVEEARSPNAAVTAFFAEQRAERQAEIEEVVTQAVRFNKKDDRDVLMEGVLPSAGEGRDARRKVEAFAELIVGEDELVSPYEPLFREINAGEPMPEAQVARRVVDAYRAEVDRAGGDLNSLSEEEREELDERMKGQRYGVYARRAEELSVYGSKEVLYGADPSEFSEVPSEVPSGSLDEGDALRWQMDYWLVEDLLNAVDLANRTPDGLRTEVPRSPVKRIVSVRLGKLDVPEKGAEEEESASSSQMNDPFANNRGGGLRQTRPTMMNPSQPAAASSSVGEPTHTGRKPDDKNGVYLVRQATITVVASSADLVRVLESFGAANFMTVTDVDLTQVDRWADLSQGYYYGDDHVVRAAITVEAAYLHFWLADIVPDFVASAWGIEKPQAEDAPAAP